MAGTHWKRISPFGGLCASKNKYGEPCGCRVVRIAKSSGKPRCRFHGGSGKQTGPKTEAGKLKAWANLSGPKTKRGRAKANRNLAIGRLPQAERIKLLQDRNRMRDWLAEFAARGKRQADRD
jgi:hypothetical protein